MSPLDALRRKHILWNTALGSVRVRKMRRRLQTTGRAMKQRGTPAASLLSGLGLIAAGALLGAGGVLLFAPRLIMSGTD